MKFEVGKYYKHNDGSMLAIRGGIDTTVYGSTLIAEQSPGVNRFQEFIAVGSDEASAENYHEATYEDWIEFFPEISKTENINVNKINIVNVRWFDAYHEQFEATEVRFGCDLLWMRLTNGENRHIPLRNVRTFSLSKESHFIDKRKEENNHG